jgi:hypothetical protein
MTHSLGLPHPITLTNYTRPGYTNLTRDVDYFIRSWQHGPYHRHKLFFTERGLHRLLLKAYRVFRPGLPSFSQQAFINRMDATVHLPRRQSRPDHIPVGTHPLAINRRVREEVATAMREYLEHPCTVPNCPCMSHRLGLPTMERLVDAGYFAAHDESRHR